MSINKEGDLYKIIEIEGTRFEIYYGYENPEYERESNYPMPMFPNFKKNPQYTVSGFPFVTGYQDICEHFKPKPKISGEGWCNDCEYFDRCEEYLGICRCEARRERQNE